MRPPPPSFIVREGFIASTSSFFYCGRGYHCVHTLLLLLGYIASTPSFFYWVSLRPHPPSFIVRGVSLRPHPPSFIVRGGVIASTPSSFIVTGGFIASTPFFFYCERGFHCVHTLLLLLNLQQKNPIPPNYLTWYLCNDICDLSAIFETVINLDNIKSPRIPVFF